MFPDQVESLFLLTSIVHSLLFHFYRLDCSRNQLEELPASLGRCLNLSDFKVRVRHKKSIFRTFVGVTLSCDCYSMIIPLLYIMGEPNRGFNLNKSRSGSMTRNKVH